jgi:nucleoside-diphosphate-sugar epimerase
MNIAITGGYGNIGISVIEECLKRGHAVTVFDLDSKRSGKLSRLYLKKNVRTVLGDIAKYPDVRGAVMNQDAIIHLAAILPPLSDTNPELCEQVNIGGIKNILEAIKDAGNKAALVEVSSASVMGPTQNRMPPVKPDDLVDATDTYSSTKIAAEHLVESSGMRYCVLRLAAVLPTNIYIKYFLNMVKVMFDMPLQARCEIVLDIDVAHALVSAAENLTAGGAMCGKRGFIAGGKRQGCQLTNGEMLRAVFDQVGLPFPRDALFSDDINGYYLDWYDTEEIQSLLNYQNHSFGQWKAIIKKKLGSYKALIRIFNRPILKWLENQSRHGVF